MSVSANWVWLGHLGILLLIAAILAPREGQRAVLLLLASVDGIAASIFVLDRPSYALLFALAAVAIMVKWAWSHYQSLNIAFTPEEDGLRTAHLAGLEPHLARRLIDEGHWIAAKKGDVLIEEAQAAPCLFYLANGTATVFRDAVEVGRCVGGDLIGEGTALEGGAATGTVRLATNARLWFVPAERLRAFLAVNAGTEAALQNSFARALRTKLADANSRAAQEGP